MPGDIEGERDLRLQIAHVLFIDIVGYSKLLTNEQRERQQELNRLVRDTGQFRAAEAEDKLVRIPTGDGLVLAFFTSPDAPVRCAVAVGHALRGRGTHPALRARSGRPGAVRRMEAATARDRRSRGETWGACSCG